VSLVIMKGGHMVRKLPRRNPRRSLADGAWGHAVSNQSSQNALLISGSGPSTLFRDSWVRTIRPSINRS